MTRAATAQEQDTAREQATAQEQDTAQDRAAASDGDGRTTAALLGGAALLLTSSALVPMFVDLRWFPPVFAVTVAVVLAGIALRSLRVPLLGVAALQAVVVAVLATVLFTRSGVAGLLPGPAAIGDLRALLAGAGRQIRDEQVPVEATAQLGVLLVLAVGAAAVVTDVFVAGLLAPAGAGLVLLTMVAVPASLSDDLLPWWTFVLGAVALVMLLLADGDRRVARDGPAAGVGGLRSPAVVGVVSVAVVVGLLGGSAALGVGTDGRLAGAGGGGGVGLNPFTQLRGQLDQPDTTDLFTVSGLATPTYLRALSLDTYVANRGWVLDRLAPGQPVTAPLDNPGVRGREVDIRVDPDRYTDRWLPTPGTPQQTQAGTETLSQYRYDPTLGTIYADSSRPLPRYSLRSVVPSADATQLKSAGTPSITGRGAPDGRFYATTGIDPEITRITDGLVPAGTDSLDAAVLLTDYFRNPTNGFVYDLRTAAQDPGSSSDALVSFLTTGKRGFCEQFSSAMATMLRTRGIPTRVGVGFTAGAGDATRRQITTDDAHAWVEVYFTGVGWVQFDPTPLRDGRGVVPDYVTQAQEQQRAAASSAVPAPATSTAAEPTPGSVPDRPLPQRDPGATADARTTADAGFAVPRWAIVTAAAVLVTLVLATAPTAVRVLRRRRRLEDGSADAVWDEILDVLADHGSTVRASRTPRQVIEQAELEYGLNEQVTTALHRLVDAIEASWYGSGGQGSGVLTSDRAVDVADTVRTVRRAISAVDRVPLRHRWWPRSLAPSVGASNS